VGTLDSVQQEQLKAIGTYLSQVRQDQARSLEEISARTYIPLRLLKAIEAGQEKPLPEPVFIQGFIRRYADALGLDGIELSQQFPVHVTPLPVATATLNGRESRRNTHEPAYPSPAADDYEPVRPVSPRSRPYTPYIAAAALLALGGMIYTITRALTRPTPQDVTRSSVTQPAATSPTAPAASPTAPAPESSPPVAPAPSQATAPSPAASPTPSAPVSVEMNLTGRSWVEVIVDGEVKVSETLPQGTRQSWSGQREVRILAGDAGAVMVAQNGETARAMGAAGDVVEKAFTPRSSAPSEQPANSVND
jgi:cytoskeletal protein RodZ